MEEIELYVENMIKNEKELKSYKYIITLLKKILINQIIEIGGMTIDASGNITKISNNIKIFIEKYDQQTKNQFVQVSIDGSNPKTIIFKVNIDDLKEKKANFEDQYLFSPVRFYMDYSNNEKGTFSVEDCNLFYYDDYTYNNYKKKTNDEKPSNKDYRAEGFKDTSKISLKNLTVSQMCKNIHTMLIYGFNAPLVEETVKRTLGENVMKR